MTVQRVFTNTAVNSNAGHRLNLWTCEKGRSEHLHFTDLLDEIHLIWRDSMLFLSSCSLTLFMLLCSFPNETNLTQQVRRSPEGWRVMPSLLCSLWEATNRSPEWLNTRQKLAYLSDSSMLCWGNAGKLMLSEQKHSWKIRAESERTRNAGINKQIIV